MLTSAHQQGISLCAFNFFTINQKLSLLFKAALLLLLSGFSMGSMASECTINTIAGTGTQGYNGDNQPATSAQLRAPQGVVVDPAGNIYLADYNNNRVRRIDTSGVITTFAGTGVAGATASHGENGAATSANISTPSDLALDSAGNLYISMTFDHQIRKVDTAGVITTVAGTGSYGYSGDGGQAISASLNQPIGLAIDAAGNLIFADSGNHRIRKVDFTSGVITTIAGTGVLAYGGDGGQATAAKLGLPSGIALDSTGNVLIADFFNSRIRRIDVATGVITTIAGTGTAGYGGDNGQATAAKLKFPLDVAVDNQDNVLIADKNNHRIRKIDAATGVITTLAGTGATGYSGDGGPPASAQIGGPNGVYVDAHDNVYISQKDYHVVRRISCAEYDYGDLPATKIRMFVTSETFRGDLKTAGGGTDGLDGADKLCQAAATGEFSQIANASGSTWKALLSTSTVNAIDRLEVDSIFVRATDPTVVIADNKAALFDAANTPLQNAVSVNEQTDPSTIWRLTGTDAAGMRTANNCQDWTSNSFSIYATYGLPQKVDSGWLNTNNANCSGSVGLYCFESNPSGYPSAKHKISIDNNPSLGTAGPDADEAYQASLDADGDDTDAGGDDEDGVSNLILVDRGTSSVDLNIGGSGKLDAFIDFNADGDFEDDGEQIANAQDYSGVTGDTTLTFNNPFYEGEPQGNFTPLYAYSAGKFFSRWRISSVGGLSASADGPQGEVEDHLFVITPTLNVADSSLTEGNTGTLEMSFTVSLDKVSNQAVSATATTSDDTATGGASCTAGVDYITTSRTVTVSPGAGGAIVNVDVCGDIVTEGDETFTLTLQAPTNAQFANEAKTVSATGTINDDDNPAPTISDIPDQMMDEDTSSSPIGFTVADSNSDDANLTVTGISNNTTLLPNSGIVIGPASPIDGSRTVTLTPAADQFGQVKVTLWVSDGHSTVGHTFLLTVTNVNDKPTANAATGTTAEDTPLTDTLTGSDPEGDKLIFAKASDPANGTVTVQASGNFTYTPNSNFNGTDSFTFKVNDGTTDSDAATATITVTGVNDKPTAKAQTVSGVTGDAITGMLTGSDPDGDTLSFMQVTGPTNGTLSVQPNGEFTYTANSGFVGTDSFTVKANDGAADSDPATVTIDVVQKPGVNLSIDKDSIPENGGKAVVTATLGAARSTDVTVTLDFTGTATSGTDYSGAATTLTIPANSTTATLTLMAIDDSADEMDESILVKMTAVSTNAIKGAADMVSTRIIDDDGAPSVSLSVDKSSIDENGGVATVTATLSNLGFQDVTIPINLGGQAGSDDYTASATSLTIAAGGSTASLTITSKDDTFDEPNEAVLVSLGTIINGNTGTPSQVTISIVDDEVGVFDTSGKGAGDKTASPGQANVVLLTFGLQNANAFDALISALNVKVATQNAVPTDIARVRIYRDLNDNGVLDSADAQLAETTNIPADGVISQAISPPYIVPAGQTHNFIVTADFKQGIVMSGEILLAGSGLLLLPLIGMVGVGRRRHLLSLVLIAVLSVGISGCDGKKKKKSNTPTTDSSTVSSTDRTYSGSVAGATTTNSGGKTASLKVVNVKGGTVTLK